MLKSFLRIRFWTKLGDIFLKDINSILDMIMALLVNGQFFSGNLSSKGLVGQEAAAFVALRDFFLHAHPLIEWGRNISSSHTLFSWDSKNCKASSLPTWQFYLPACSCLWVSVSVTGPPTTAFHPSPCQPSTLSSLLSVIHVSLGIVGRWLSWSP